MLALLAINDGPPPTDYQREDWAHWLDPDHNGCDAREDALAQASDVAATVGAACRVSAGHWISAYDGLETSDAGTFDVDHVVPLGNAYVSGGNTWPAERRAGYANDQADLWVVSASSNRSKGDRPPSQWRPPRAEVWCLYATRWTQIKLRWNLTATTPERDALGQMLATCAVPPSAG
jgi:hypothetical protein